MILHSALGWTRALGAAFFWNILMSKAKEMKTQWNDWYLNSEKEKKTAGLTSGGSKGPVHGEGWERHRPEGELGVRVPAGRGRQDPGVLGTFQRWHRNGADHSYKERRRKRLNKHILEEKTLRASVGNLKHHHFQSKVLNTWYNDAHRIHLFGTDWTNASAVCDESKIK